MRWRLAGVLLAAVAILAVEPATFAAQNQADGDRDAKIRELQGLVGEASAAESAALKELSAVRAKRQQLDAAVHSYDTRVTQANTRLNTATEEVNRVAGQYLALQDQLDQTNRDLDHARQIFRTSVADLYQNGSDSIGGLTHLVGHASSLHELQSGIEYLEGLSDARREDVDDYVKLRDDTARTRDELVDQKRQADELKAKAANERDQIASLQAAQAKARSQVAAEEQQENKLIASIRARKNEFTNELALLKATSDQLAVQLRQRQANQSAAGIGALQRPVQGPITSGFGPRTHPIFGDVRIHTGVDFDVGSGTPIHAAAAGVVYSAGPLGGYGNCVIIDHGNTLATLYAHQSRIAVSAGQTVKQGDVIGYVGATGYATGPHLHFEVRKLGTPVDPMRYL